MRNSIHAVAFRLNRGMPRALGLAVSGLLMVQIAGCDSREEQLVDVHSERAEAGEAEEERAKDIAKEREKQPADHNPLATPTKPADAPTPPTDEQPHGGTVDDAKPAADTKANPGPANQPPR